MYHVACKGSFFFITLRLCMYHVAYKKKIITLRRNLLPSLLLVWPTQLDPALGTLIVCVCVCVCMFLCVRSLFGVTSSNVELRNYVISRQIVIERRVT